MCKIPLIAPQYHCLENGFSVCLYGGFSSRHSHAAIVFNAKCGLYCENAANNGITHAIEHMLFKGSENYNNFELTAAINSLGGAIDAFTTSDSLGIEITVPPKSIPQALRILSDLVLRPLFPQHEIELEKKVILEEIRYYEDDPEDLVMLKLERSCFSGSSYSREILGTKSSVSSLKKKELEDYHRSYFTPANCALTITGCFDESSALKDVEFFFGKNAWSSASTGPKSLDFYGLKNTKKHHIVKRGSRFVQNYFGLGFITPSSLDGAYICSMLLPYVFSSLKSSPLLFTLKDRLNAINSITTDLGFKYGAWMVSILASYKPGKGAIVKKTIADFIAGAHRIITAEYFENIKHCLMLDYLQEIETPRSYCSELSTFNHILGDGSYNRAVETILNLDYSIFVKYLRDEIAPLKYQTVELISKNVKSGVADKQAFSLFFDRGSNEKTGVAKYSPAYIKSRRLENPEISTAGSGDNFKLSSVTDRSMNYSTLTAYFSGGAASSLKIGDAYVFAELLGKKSKKMNVYDNYNRSDSMGLYFEFNAILDSVKLDATTTGAWTAEKLSHLNELIWKFDFGKTAFRQSARSVINTIKSMQDDVFEISFWNFIKNLFANAPYSMNIFGNEKLVGRLEPGDIESYYKRFLNSPFTSLSYASSDKCDELMADFFSCAKNVSGVKPVGLKTDEFNYPVFKKELSTSQQQCTIIVGSGAPSIVSADCEAFSLANHILSDYTGKRLWNIREKYGLCYNIFSEYIPLGLGGAFFAYANTGADMLQMAADMIIEEIDKLASEGPSIKELNEAKNQMIKRHENILSSSSAIARSIAQTVFYKKCADDFNAYPDKIRKLTGCKVMEAFRSYVKKSGLSVLKIIPD